MIYLNIFTLYYLCKLKNLKFIKSLFNYTNKINFIICIFYKKLIKYFYLSFIISKYIIFIFSISKFCKLVYYLLLL